jgi:GNAT superfamily N-acetyltransferase
MMSGSKIHITNSPAIPGLRFRRFRGEIDFQEMAAVINASADIDRLERADTVEDLANNYAHLTNCDPYQDMVFAEVAGEMIGYSRGMWWDEPETGRMYGNIGFITPAWRRMGIGQAMLIWMEGRLREIAKTHPPAQPKFFQVWASQFQKGTTILLERAGYRPVRYFDEMIRTSLEKVPNIPVPEGLDVRLALPEHFPKVWEALDETSQDHWGYSRFTEEQFQSWKSSRFFQPHLWQIAWDIETDQIAGHVLTFIDHAQNDKFARKRGYTESIGVRRPWRRRGLATALIMRSLLAQRAAGMTESALNVDSENLSGASRIYQRCGFAVIRRNTIYRKPL